MIFCDGDVVSIFFNFYFEEKMFSKEIVDFANQQSDHAWSFSANAIIDRWYRCRLDLIDRYIHYGMTAADGEFYNSLDSENQDFVWSKIADACSDAVRQLCEDEDDEDEEDDDDDEEEDEDEEDDDEF